MAHAWTQRNHNFDKARDALVRAAAALTTPAPRTEQLAVALIETAHALRNLAAADTDERARELASEILAAIQ